MSNEITVFRLCGLCEGGNEGQLRLSKWLIKALESYFQPADFVYVHNGKCIRRPHMSGHFYATGFVEEEVGWLA